MQRRLVRVATGILAAAALGAAGAPSAGLTSSDALSRALVSSRDLPGHRTDYRAPRGSSSRGVCGLKPPRTPKPRDQASAAWAEDRKDAPILGERIELYASGKAALRLQDSKTPRLQDSKGLPLPCEWDEFNTHWQATAEPPIELGDDNWVYVIQSLTGPKGFTYEVKLRRGNALLLFVLNSRQPDRALLEDLVQRGWTKADARLRPG